ncbi:MAG: peptidase S41, partial [Odoribacter sp.]|nr:peptidase S41 [Odoribacter sp.]
FVPADTSGYSEYWVRVNRLSQVLYEYTFDFMDRHRTEMKDIRNYKQLLKYLERFDLVNEMADYAAQWGIKRDAKGIRTSYTLLDNTIKAFIGRHVLDDEGFYPIFQMNDETVKKAVKACAVW